MPMAERSHMRGCHVNLSASSQSCCWRRSCSFISCIMSRRRSSDCQCRLCATWAAQRQRLTRFLTVYVADSSSVITARRRWKSATPDAMSIKGAVVISAGTVTHMVPGQWQHLLHSSPLAWTQEASMPRSHSMPTNRASCQGAWIEI